MSWQLPAADLSMYMTLLALALATVLLIVKRHAPTVPAGRKSLMSLPTPPEGNMILGQLLQLLHPSMHLKLTGWANQLGPLYRVRLADKTVMVASDAQLIMPLLGSGPDALPKAGFAYQAANDIGVPGMDGIFSVTDFHDEYWRTARKGLAMAFSMNHLRKTLLPVARSRARQLAQAWSAAAGAGAGAGALLDVSEDLMDTTMDILLASAFKMDIPEAEKAEFLKNVNGALDEISLRVTNPLRQPVMYLLPFLPWSRRKHATFKAVQAFWRKVYRHIRSSGPYSPDDMSLAACFWRLEEEHGFTPRQVTANIAPMFVGGYETSSGTVAWTLYNIAAHPEVQAKLVSELRGAGLLAGQAGSGATCGADSEGGGEWGERLPYFNAVVRESMRLHPIAASTSTIREADRDVTIAGYHVPRGTVIWAPLTTLHTSQHNWESPLAFKPERWLGSTSMGSDVMQPAEGSAGGSRDAAFMPFGYGPRNCIGQNMGNLVVRVVLLELLSLLWFEVPPCMGTPEQVHSRQLVGLTLKCQGGMHLTARQHQQA